MDINTASGEKVIFINENGWPGEAERARVFIVPNQELTVERLEVGQSCSSVTFVEFPNMRFNTAMFKNNTPTWNRYDWFARDCYIGIVPITNEEFAEMPFDETHMSDAVLQRLQVEQLTHSVTDMDPLHHPDVESNIAASISAVVLNKDKTVLITLRRYSHILTFINPNNEQEAVDAFVNEYGHEPNSINTLYIEGNSFNPYDLGVGDRY